MVVDRVVSTCIMITRPYNILRYVTAVKNVSFQMTNCEIFLIFAQNIDRGYMLEPPHRRVIEAFLTYDYVPIYVNEQNKQEIGCKQGFQYTPRNVELLEYIYVQNPVNLSYCFQDQISSCLSSICLQRICNVLKAYTESCMRS